MSRKSISLPSAQPNTFVFLPTRTSSTLAAHQQHTSIFCTLFNVKTAGPIRMVIFHRSVQTVQVARQMETVAESFGFVRRAHPSLRSCLGKSGADGTKPLSVTSLEGWGGSQIFLYWFSLVATAGDTFFV